MLISVSSVYCRAGRTRGRTLPLLAQIGEYELLLQTELQHLIDLLYRSYGRAVSPDTPAISNSFPWVRGIGIVDTASEIGPKKSPPHPEPRRGQSMLGGQITFAIVNDSDVLWSSRGGSRTPPGRSSRPPG